MVSHGSLPSLKNSMKFAQSLLILLHLQVCVCETERKILINENVLQMADHVKHK